MPDRSRSPSSTSPAAHLPSPFMSSHEYDLLYAFNLGVDDSGVEDTAWREKRIRPGRTAEEVYALLPSAPDFEYGGYLTKTRIRYAACEAMNSDVPHSKLCTFHSHPTNLDGTEPDLPSVDDVYAFLKFRSLRAITVGKHIIWVMEKSRRTVPTIRKLADWERQHLVAAFSEQIKRHPDRAKKFYRQQVIRALGVEWPVGLAAVTDKFRASWPRLLQETLGIDVTLQHRTNTR